MEKIFGVVIIYHPDEAVKKNMATYADALSKLIILDNSEPSCMLDCSGLTPQLVMVADGVNRGISERLNSAAQMAIAENATWLLTMDQDSFFDPRHLNNYLEALQHLPNKQQVAMLGVALENEPPPAATAPNPTEPTDMLITSGSLLNLEVYKKVGGFDEQLFIDEVDYEYCVRANAKGYQTLKLPHIFLHHTLGTVTSRRSLKNFSKTPRTLHTPSRLYYICRNFLYVRRKYKHQLPASMQYKKHGLLNRIKNNLLYGTNRIQVLKYLLLAIRHYKAKRMGRL